MAEKVTPAEADELVAIIDGYLYAMKAQYQVDAEVVADFERALTIATRLAADVEVGSHDV